jgi:hypothetical protein
LSKGAGGYTRSRGEPDKRLNEEVSLMALTLKCFLGLFILMGIAVVLYALHQLWETSSFVKVAPGRGKATFVGYDQEAFKTSTSSPSPTNWGQQDFHETRSVMSYPTYSYIAEDGLTRHVREPKAHIVEVYKPGQQVDIVLSSSGYSRLAGFYSLYVMDLVILVFGLGFVLIPLMIGRVVIPSLETKAGMEMAAHVKNAYEQIASSRVGPISVATFMKGVAIFFALTIVVCVIAGVTPYLRQLGFGTGSSLITALEHERYDDARKMIIKGKGINRVNNYNQSALLIALEKGQRDLARMLIDAGADVNIKSKMYMTPLRVSTQAGDLETVKLLLSKGASPDAPEDESPPIAYALLKGKDDIARALIEGGTNLHRRYVAGERSITVGDMAVLSRKADLVELIRRRGGVFTVDADAIAR